MVLLFSIPYLSCLSSVVVHVCYLHFTLLFLFNCALNDPARLSMRHKRSTVPLKSKFVAVKDFIEKQNYQTISITGQNSNL